MPYLWSTFVGGLIQYAIMLVLILASPVGSTGVCLRSGPGSRWRAVGRALIALVVIVVATAVLSPFLDAGDEQGLVPNAWDATRAAPFLANAAVVILVAPFVEELLFRGLGYGLLLEFSAPFRRS